MKVKKLAVISLLSVYVLTVSAPLQAVLTNSDDMSKVTKLGLDYATAIAEKKDASEGTKDIIKKQFDDWTWNYVVGNYEKLIFQNAEAEIPAFKEKIGKMSELLERIGNISTQLGEGKYDEAAFTAVDQAVATFDHPLVSTMWASVKLAYESHKLVQQSKAELQIETLYGALDSDRRLRGASSGDGPKLFNMDSQTVDYFFNKYLITNDSTREMVKAYVKVRLNEEFPEASYLESFKGWLTGSDSAKEEELAQLEQYKNTSRRWIMELLKDLNNQATARYNEVRVQQQLAEFQRFAAKFKNIDASIESLLNEFRQINEYKKESAKYSSILSGILTQKAAVQAELKNNKLSISQKKHILTKAEEVYLECMKYWSRANIIGNTGFAGQFKANMNELDGIIKQIKLSMETSSSDVLVFYSNEMGGQNKAYFSSLFSGLLTEYVFKVDFETYKQKYMELLNSGDFKAAEEVLHYTYIYNNYMGKGIENELEAMEAHYKEILANAQKKYENESKKLAADLARVSLQIGQIIDNGGTPPMSLYNSYDSIKQFISDLDGAKSEFDKAVSDLWTSQAQKYQDFEKEIIDNYNIFKALADDRKKELENYRAILRPLYTQLPIRVGATDGLPLFSLSDARQLLPVLEIENAKFFLDKLNQESTLGYKFSNASARNVGGVLTAKTMEIAQKIDELRRVIQVFENETPKTIKIWENGKKQWDALKKPESEDIAQFIVFADENFDYEKEFGICESAAAKTEAYISELRRIQSEYITKAETEISNMEKDYDYFNAIVKQYDSWIKEKITQKVLELDIAPSGVPLQKDKTYSGEYRLGLNTDPVTGMIVINEPYPHYATAQEIKNIAILQQTKNELVQKPFYKFLTSNMPEVANYFNRLLSGDLTQAAKEENFIIGKGLKNTIWKTNIDEAELALSKISPESEYYYQNMKVLSEKIPFLIEIISKEDKEKLIKESKDPYILIKAQQMQADNIGSLVKIDEEPLKALPLGQRFVALRAKAQDLLTKRAALINKKIQDESNARENSLKVEYFFSEIKKIKDSLEKISNDSSEKEHLSIDEIYTNLYNLKGQYNKSGLANLSLNNAFDELEKDILNLIDKNKDIESQKLQKIKDFYISFKQAYESQNDSLLMNLTSDSWDAGDGTTVSDLEENFRNMFTVFDSIQYNISGLNVQKFNENIYNVSYDVEIIGNMYNTGIKRNEKSSVSEQVIIDKNGKIKINKTLRGNYWYIK